MHILTINAGSSSLKAKYFSNFQEIVSILIEEISSDSSKATLKYNFQTFSIIQNIPTHKEALTVMEQLFKKANISDKLLNLDIIAHRIVHGGALYYKPTRITPKVITKLKSISQLAPLHNPINIKVIEIFLHKFNVAQFAIFDTAFHHTIPRYASSYAIPDNISKQYHIKKYGFHGISYAYITYQISKFLNISQENINVIALHLGNGASITAIKDGKSIDTSMGITPLSGLIMGSRCGDIDASIIPYLASHGYDIDKIDDILNHQSGLKSLCGTNDFRKISQMYYDNNPQAIKAIDMYVYKIVKYIGSYAILLDRIDAIVFSGGIGENSSLLRELVINKIPSFLNTTLDKDKNNQKINTPTFISTHSSHIPIVVIPTNEELQMVRYVMSM